MAHEVFLKLAYLDPLMPSSSGIEGENAFSGGHVLGSHIQIVSRKVA